MENNIQQPQITASTIYEGGVLNPITISDLLNNKLAIRQLINNYNEKVQQAEQTEKKVCALTSSLEYIKTTPYMSIFTSIINILGTIVIGLGVNQYSNSENGGINDLLVIGDLLVLLANLANIFYPYAKQWYNN